MRLELTQKFVLGQIAVVIVALTLPPVMRHLGVSAWGAVALVFGVSALMVWLFSRQISRRFRVLRACTDRIGRGDLSGGVELSTPVLFPDETSDLAESLNSMLQNLRELVRHIQEVAGQVTESSRELSEGSQLVNEANLELGASMERVAEAAVRQQADLAHIAFGSRENAEEIKTNFDAAREAYGFVAEASDRATRGVDVSRMSVIKMQALLGRVDQARGLVFDLDQKIRSVHRISGMITSVADKTHLLSLNASIEAARAGDAGRAFSVVAQEIRQLAESASSSAEQIEQLMHHLEDESVRIAEVMSEMGDGVGSGREDLDSIQQSLERIQDAVLEASERAESISRRADERVEGAQQTARECDDIADAATENVKVSDQMRLELGVQTQGVEKIVRHASHLVETSLQLCERAGRFRIRPPE